MKVLAQLKKKIGNIYNNRAVIEGIHAEGPLVATCGGLAPTDIQLTEFDFKKFLDQIPSLKIMTISPSLEAKINYSRLKILLQRDIVPALGHDNDATEDDIVGALQIAGETQLHITHLFNVTKLHHREIGLTNVGLLSTFPNLPKVYLTI